MKSFATNSWFVREVQMLIQMAAVNARRALKFYSTQSPHNFDTRFQCKRDINTRIGLRLVSLPLETRRKNHTKVVNGHFLERTSQSPSNGRYLPKRCCICNSHVRTTFKCGRQSCISVYVCNGACFAAHVSRTP